MFHDCCCLLGRNLLLFYGSLYKGDDTAMKDVLSIWSELIKNPKALGTVAPSSTYLGKHLVASSQLTQNMNVVEIGAGTGPLTSEILKVIPKNQFWAFEPNPVLAGSLCEKFDDICVYENKAMELPMIQSRDQLPKADRILCSLPWSIFDEQVMKESLGGIAEGLHPDGVFDIGLCSCQILSLHLHPYRRNC